ncbi:response regulator [Simiduia sp. 21SJ11W-1]|uniref:response regulator n=1 Tax=Simiduia sp. 21SJ11W-1 TaxID=2909669 RepID=UPI0020A1FC75|nr:response regulator [Simiduia sp. 21SJ11W-1]UTA46280.1 response regulator [Simiduia sp. 21SJ11W-1]
MDITQSIKRRSLRIALLPTALLTLALALLLTGLYVHQLGKLSIDRGYHLSRLLSQLTYQSMHNRLLLQSVVQTSVSDGDIRAVRVYDLNRNPLIHAGNSFSLVAQLDPARFALDANHQILDDSTLFIVPIHADHDSFAPFGWLAVEISNDDYTLLEYQTLLLALVLGMAAAIASGAIALNYGQQLSTSLNDLKLGLQQLQSGALNTRLEGSNLPELNELLTAFNKLALSLKESREEIQRNMDQSIEDLRETLETIEIQNIELDLARKEAVEASRVKSDFLANTSHEIRTPLNGIIGFTSLLLKTPLTDQQKEYMRTIQHSSQGLLTIINDVLDFSKIESGRLQLDYVPMQLRQVVEEAMQIMAPAAHEKHIQLILLIDRSLPTHLLGDPLRLKQVLTNLVSNAIKFSHGGNVIIRAELKQLEETQVEVSITVEDSGVGVSEQDRSKLFQAFSQADSSNSRKHGGTGLGLAVSKGLIKRMHGEIGVKNSDTGGALFWFTAQFGIEQESYQQQPQHQLANCHFAMLSNNTQLCTQVKEIVGAESGKIILAKSTQELVALVKKQAQINMPVEAIFYDIEPQQERRLDFKDLNELICQMRDHYSCNMFLLGTPSARRVVEHNLPDQTGNFLEKPITQARLLNMIRAGLTPEKEETRIGQQSSFDHKPSILAVDDNPANLQLVGELLSGLGMDVTLASDGKQAVEIADKQIFDMVFMDLQMPIMDGIEATKIIRSRELGKRRTPIVALTAHAMAEQKSQLLLAGMDDYLSKPVSEAQLAHVINRWLKARKMHAGWIKEIHELQTPKIETTQPEAGSKVQRVVDLQESLALANNKPHLARDMLSMLLNTLESDQQSIQQSFASEDYKTLESTVHRLHGGCCYCGVAKLREAAHDLDRSLQAKETGKLEIQIERLNIEIDALLQWGKSHDVDVLFAADETEVSS